MNTKISIIGAGNVGSTLAMRIAERGLADVVIVDIKEGVAKARSLDISDAASIIGYESKVYGTENFNEIRDSSLVVITAGFPRNPGMKREELLSKNKKIIESVSLHIKKYASNSIVIVVTNPLDIMTYITYKTCGFSKNRVLGMAGDLDTSRFIELIAQKLSIKKSSIVTLVMGSHGDTMVPVISHTKVSGNPLEQMLSKKEIDILVKDTKIRGAHIVSLLGQGSAYFAPSAAIAELIESVLTDAKKVHCVSAFLKGEYGLSDICIGVPARVGRNGIEEILEIDLSPDEKEAFKHSAKIIKDNLVYAKI